MGSSKKSRGKKIAQTQRSNGGFSDGFRNFKTLFPDIQSPEGMKTPVLKNLYLILANLSMNSRWSVKFSAGSNDFDLETHHDGIRVTFGDISELSNILFKELEQKYEQLFSDLRDDDVPEKDLGECSSNLGLFGSVDVVNFLFRCCLMLLTLLAAKQNLVLEKGVILLRIVKKSSSPEFLVENTRKSSFIFEKSFFRQFAPGDDNGCSTSSIEGFTASLQFLGPNNPLLFFMSTILGVFVDELLAHGQLRGYFKMINSFVSTAEALYSPHSAQEDIGIVIEVLCNHFILSFSDKQAVGDFLSRLFCTHATDLKYASQAPSLSVSTAVSLLLSPIMVYAPKYMQAHLTSLVSEAFTSRSLKPDRKLVNCFLSAFEKTVDLYLTHMSCLEKDGYPTFPRGFRSRLSRGVVHPPFEFYVSPDTKHKVDSVITNLENLTNVNSEDVFFRMKSDMVSSSMRFVKECLHFYAISSQDEILTVLSCLVLKASGSYVDEDIRPVEGTNLQNLYILASILKLIGISLLQAISHVGNNDNDSRCMKSLKGFASCKEYDFVLEIMSCFGDLDIGLPLQKEIGNVLSSHSTRHAGSKMMFLHFLGLLSLSFESGLHCLVKACLLVILALLNLFVFEEGDLDAFRAMIDSAENDSGCGFSEVRLQETMVNQNSSLVVASKFHKTRSLYSRGTPMKDFENENHSLQTMANASGMETVACLEEEEESEETSNGEIFLKCMSKMGEGVSNFDDLVGFVECKQGKDYSAWLKNRQKYRKWRFEKLAVLKWKKKKKTWRSLKGSKGKIN